MMTSDKDNPSTNHHTDDLESDAKKLQSLFHDWKKLERELDTFESKEPLSIRQEESRDELLASQSELMEQASRLQANNLAGLLYKLALWRWDHIYRLDGLDSLTRAEGLAYTAFLDLARLTGISDVLKPEDGNSQ